MLIRLSAAVVGIVSLLSVVSSLCMHKVYSHKLPFTRVERFLFYPHPHPHSPHRYTTQHLASSELLPGDSIARAPFNSIIPFLSEHVQPSDQILFVGTKTDLCLQLASAGYGTKKTGFMLVVDDNKERIRECESIASSDKQLAALMSNGQLRFVCADLTNMPEVCKQSHFDAVVDYYGLDSLLLNPSVGMQFIYSLLFCLTTCTPALSGRHGRHVEVYRPPSECGPPGEHSGMFVSVGQADFLHGFRQEIR